MSDCKVAVIGAGSYVFGPSVLSEAILRHRLPDLELALVDVDGEVLELMAGVARRMARETGVNTRIATHTERLAALDGADFVICSASPQMLRRFTLDCDIVDRYLPGHLITEFGGIAGISYSLRQIALIESIAADIKRLCPNAWLLNVANPLPRVCQAAHEMDIKTAGFCSVSIQGYGMIARLMGDAACAYPFAEPRAKYDAVMAGVNHFSWLCELRDRQTGEDLIPTLREHIRQGGSSGHSRAEQMARETGWLLMPGDDHTRDFLAPQGDNPSRQSPSHGSGDERRRRLTLMRDIAEGRQPWDELLAHPSWEKPFDVIAALAYGRPARVHSLNLPNDGQTNMPADIFVETACAISSEGVKPDTVALPPPVAALCRQTALVTETIVWAARERSLALLHSAVELDPTILDKRAGCEAIDACVGAHADLLPAYI